MPNFLVVDDNRLLNRFLTTYLKGKGHNASSLIDLIKVEPWLDHNSCDGLIIDPTKRLYQVNEAAFTLIRTVREKHPTIKIIGFAGINEPEVRDSIRKAGADGFVSKGLGPSEIYSAICGVMGQQQMQVGGVEPVNYLG